MTWNIFLDILKDSIRDSLLVFVFVFFFHLVLSFIEKAVANFLVKRKRTAPLFGAMFGLIPQCGTSVVAADLYTRKYITIGTLVAVFLACSDEALLVLLTSWNEKTFAIFPLIGLKLLVGASVGLLVDVFIRKQSIKQADHVEEEPVCIEHHHEKTPVHEHLVHPLVHALKILLYVFVINLALGLLIGFVGQEYFNAFMLSNKYLAPLFASIIGLIPNCASSVFITELYLANSLSFGALFAGLLVNTGLGVMVLIKEYKNVKQIFYIIGLCFVLAVVLGYVTCFVVGF